MTRFARSEGSKASNKREPEEATPWGVQVAVLNREKCEAGVEDDVDYGDYDDAGSDDDIAESALNGSVVADTGDNEDSEGVDEELEPHEKLGDLADFAKKRKLVEEDSENLENAAPKKKKKNQKCKICKSLGHIKMDCPDLTEERRKELQELFVMKTERKGKGTGRKKTKKKDSGEALSFENDNVKVVKTLVDKNSNDAEVLDATKKIKPKKEKKGDKEPSENGEVNKNDASEAGLSKAARNKLKRQKQKEKKKQNLGKATTGEKPSWKKPVHKHTPNPNKREIKARDGTVVQDGEGLFHGFRVKKEDVKRLKQLYYDMKNKGIPRTEIDVLIKKERRSCENELNRMKKKVCLNCRQEGHWLAQCPRANSSGVKETKEKKELKPNSGLCFKCGSLDHTSKDCKSKLKGENAFRFAVCFICNEEGHLAKACPDNPKGLYPKGGGCIFCGSVEHLKRDCPRKVEKDSRSEVRVGTMSRDLEDEPDENASKVKVVKEKGPKVVSF